MSSTTKPDQETPVTGEVVPASAATAATQPRTAKELDAWLKATGESQEDPDAGAYERIIAQVLSATSPDIVLTPVEAVNAADVIGVPLLLFGHELNESEFDVGSPFYASMQCVVAQDQTPAVINCGHKKVIAQLVKLKQFDQYPYQVMFRARGKSRVGGTDMLELVKWEQDGQPPF